MRMAGRGPALLIIFMILFAASMFAGLSFGSVDIPVFTVAQTLLSLDDGSDRVAHQIIRDLRLPRVLAAFVCGGLLALAGLLPMALLRWRVNLLSLADEEAQALGVAVARLRLVLVAGATLSTAAAVSLTGIIGWVGLVVPHVARLWVGPEFSRLLPASLLLGGGFLVATDTLARTLAPIELPLGILTAFVGVPFFLFVLARSGGRE